MLPARSYRAGTRWGSSAATVRQVDAVAADPRRRGAGCRLGRHAAPCPDRHGGAGSAGRREEPDRCRAGRRHRAHGSCSRRPRRQTAPSRIADIQTRLVDIGAHSAPARAARSCAGLGFVRRSERSALLGAFGRLAHAGGARGGAVCRARYSAARRAENYLDLEGMIWLEDPTSATIRHRGDRQPRPRSPQRRASTRSFISTAASSRSIRAITTASSGSARAAGAAGEVQEQAGGARRHMEASSSASATRHRRPARRRAG